MGTTQDVTVKVEAAPPVQAVVERVAACEGVDHTELVPLYEAIDPEALNRLVETSRHNDSALQIVFTYHGYNVTVTCDDVDNLAREDAIEG